MKKLKTLSVLVLGIMAVSATLTSCSCEHEWKEATCTEAKTCTLCNDTEGEALGHKFEAATCILPEICTVCEAEGKKALGHDWKEATCTEEKVCKICEEVGAEALGHDWKEATCTEPKTCSRCQLTTGTTISHTVESWEIVTPSTCSETGVKTGTCVVCSGSITEDAEKLEHTLGDWVVTKKAMLYESGEKTQSCTVCSEIVKTEKYDLTEEEEKSEYKKLCKTYSYKEVARNPYKYDGEYAKFTGKVIQVQGDMLLVNISSSNNIYVIYYQKYNEPRILENDRVTVYGELDGEKTYTTVRGNAVTIPKIKAEYVDVK